MVAVAYLAPFVVGYVLLPPPADRLFLAAYLALVVISLALPMRSLTGYPARSESKYLSLIAALGGGSLVSVYLVVLSALPLGYPSALLGGEGTKYLSVFWIFLSTAVLVAAPGVRLTRLGNFLRKNGMDAIGKWGEYRSRDDHFLLDYSTQQWFRHANFLLLYFGLLGVYFYGWFLLGMPFLFVSIPLIVLASLVVRSLAQKLLSPFDPLQVIAKIESTYPARTFKANFRRPSRGVMVLVIALFSLYAYSAIVENPFAGINLIIFILLLLLFSVSLFLDKFNSTSAKSPSARV